MPVLRPTSTAANVEIMGLVTELKVGSKNVACTVNDGTGFLRCTKWPDPDAAQNDSDWSLPISCGQFLIIRGKVSASGRCVELSITDTRTVHSH